MMSVSDPPVCMPVESRADDRLTATGIGLLTAAMSLASWLYVSISRLTPEDAMNEVEKIVAVSRPRNRELDVTGALLFTGERFAQLIEGPPDGVAALQQSIFRDARHCDVTTIHSHDVDAREFMGWSLAYAGPSRLVSKVVTEGIAESARDPRQGSQILMDLLHKFSLLDR